MFVQVLGLVLDDASSADYTWSTGNYLGSGGATLNNTTINLTNPAGYPDPTQFTAADLVTVSGENTCNEPTLTANCAGVTITPDAR